MKEWFVYLLRNSQVELYCGIALDVVGRLGKHNQGKGAKRTRGRGPWAIVWAICIGSRSTALKLEYRIKQLPKQQKIDFMRNFMSVEDMRKIFEELDKTAPKFVSDKPPLIAKTDENHVVTLSDEEGNIHYMMSETDYYSILEYLDKKAK